MDAAPIPPTSFGYAARFASTAPEKRRSGEKATKKSRSATRPDARSRAGANRAARVADRQRRLEDHGAAGVDAGGDRGDGRVHVPVVGLVLRVEHDGHDEHDDVRRAGGLRGVERGPEAALGVDPGDELREARLLADVRAAGVDGLDDGRVDVDRDHVPAVGGELGGERQAHLAGADDGHGAGRPLLARPGVDRPGRGVDARARAAP